MCLLVKDNWKRDEVSDRFIPLKARKDITCYKKLLRRVNGYFRTPYEYTEVRIGQRMKAKLGIRYYTVHEGIHAFTTVMKDFNEIFSEDEVLVECTIPKGAEYVRGKHNDIVATEMKLKKIIKNL